MGLALYLLGIPRVEVDGHPLPVMRRQVRALLYYLALHPGGVSRDTLAMLFAPNEPQAVARRRLTRLLWLLRQVLPPQTSVHTDSESISLTPPYWVDTQPFLQTLHAVQHAPHIPAQQIPQVEEALTLYRGEFLQGFTLPHHADLETWILVERERFLRLYLEGVTQLTRTYVHQGQWAEAITWARQGIAHDPLREELHRLLIYALAHAGERGEALRHYEEYVVLLERELGVDPLPETRALYQTIFQGTLPTLPSPAPTGGSAPRGKRPIPFQGREEELRILLEAWRHVQEQGEGRVLFISGEPGIGKTRLVQEFLRQVAGPILTGAGVHGAQEHPYYPIQVALSPIIPHLVEASRRVPPEILAELSRLFPGIHRLRPDIPPPLALEGEVGRAYLRDVLVRLFDYLAPHPTVFVVEDAHWTGDAFWEWLTVLTQNFSRLPLLLIITYRPEEAPQALRQFRLHAQHRGWAREVTLQGLAEEHVGELIRALSPPPSALTSRFIREVQQHTGGNPYFVLETTRWLLEQPGQGVDLPIPERVRDVLRYRLELLSPLSRHVLNAAAVLNPHITPELLRETAARQDEEIAEALEDLLHRHLLVVQEGPAPRYQFAHHQLFRVVYEAMSPARRQLLHRRAAQALARAHTSCIPNLDALLAHHWEAAGEVEQALAALLRAMENAARQFAHAHLCALADRALALAELLTDQEKRLAIQAESWLWKGRGHRALGDYARAHEALDEAIRLAEVGGFPRLILDALAEKIPMAINCWQEAEATQWVAQCLDVADQCQDESLRARALYLREMVAVHFQHPFSRATWHAALQVFKREQDPVRLAEMWNLRGVAALMTGEYEEALFSLDRALMYARRVSHYFLMHRIQANRGHVLYNLGDFLAAWQAFESAVQWLRRVGVERPDHLFDVGRGFVALHLGLSEEAEERLEHARSLALRMNSLLGRLYADIHLALLAHLQGRTEEALDRLRDLLEVEDRVYAGAYIWLLERWGMLLRSQGQVQSALRAHKQALRKARQHNNLRREASVLCQVAEDLIVLGHPQGARALFQRALRLSMERGEKALVARALAGLVKTPAADPHLLSRAVSTARSTHSLLLLSYTAHAIREYHPTWPGLPPLMDDLGPRLQKAGWQ